MSYTKKTWTAGQKVKSADLNNMEGGIDAAANPFIVTLTPTAQDFSGVMDKTVSEIQAAHDLGKTIIFRIVTGVNEFVDIPCSFVAKFSAYTFMNFGSSFVYPSQSAMIVAQTMATDTDTKNTYTTTIYPLTPMS